MLLNPMGDLHETTVLAKNENPAIDSAVWSIYSATAIPRPTATRSAANPAEAKTNTQNLLQTAADGLNGISKSGALNLLVAVNDTPNPPSATFNRGATALVRVDAARRTLTYVTLPADLQMTMPNKSVERLDNLLRGNSETTVGDASMFEQIVEQNFQIDVNAYLVVNRAGFERAIDQLGKLSITVPSATQPPTITKAAIVSASAAWRPGTQVMNGATLWRYLTYRDGSNETESEKRTRAVGDALALKARRPEIFAQVLALYVELAGQYETNLTANQLLGLALMLRALSAEQVTVRALNGTMVTTTPNASVPNWDRVRAMFVEWR